MAPTPCTVALALAKRRDAACRSHARMSDVILHRVLVRLDQSIHLTLVALDEVRFSTDYGITGS